MTEKWDLFSNLWTLLLHCSEIHIRGKCTNGSTQKLNYICSLALFSTNSLDPYLLWDCMNTASFCFCQQGHEEARGGQRRWRVCQGCCSSVPAQSWHTQYFHILHKATKYPEFGRKEVAGKHWQTLAPQRQKAVRPWIMTTAQVTR